MKLLSRYNTVNLFTTILVLLITGVIYYSAISFILNHQVDKNITVEEEQLYNYTKLNKKLPVIGTFKRQLVKFTPVKSSFARRFIDTSFYNAGENEYEAARGLLTALQVNGEFYKLEIVESKVETEDLIKIIFMITIGVISLLVLVLFLMNRFILNRIWQPFYKILQQLRDFNLTDKHDMVLARAHIDEFDELSREVTAMAARVKTDYSDLKAFTENAAHELLTPIAVINSKLDSLIQTEEFNPTQSKILSDVYSAVSRLTRLNQSLLLLVKVENRLVNDEQIINLKLLIEDKIAQFHELFLDKELTITADLEDKDFTISRYLIEVLLNNLVNNAVRHNRVGGDIKVVLNHQRLVISNTGASQELNNEEVFKRFNKSSNSEGSGLGLTISKQICDNYGFKVSYHYNNPWHQFTIEF
jgi:signal transduction histidine kinase